MFSDILTPLPALGIEFDVVKGKGPMIEQPIKSLEEVRQLRVLKNPEENLGFVGETLSRLRGEVSDAALLAFIGTPWTSEEYSIEGGSSKNCFKTKVFLS